MNGNSVKKTGLENIAYEKDPKDVELKNGNIRQKIGLENIVYEKDPKDVELKNGNIRQEIDEDVSTDRPQWGNGLEFLMSCIAMSVGLGNIWRFPFVANNNGGGAFLIPYLIVLTVIGRPMYYMEMALGQFSSKGTLKMYSKLSPVLKGIGYGQIIGSFFVGTYYCSIMAVTLFYMINSFTSDFPWAKCSDSWTDYTTKHNITCVGKDPVNVTTEKSISSSELYFKLDVLKQEDDISDGLGIPDWRLTLLLLLSWIVTFLVSVRGVKSSGKAAYFLALFPYVVMITLLARAATLEGAVDGMYYFIETDWSKLLEAEVWYAAVTQCFFSLNVGFGSIIMFSSYNKFQHNINRDALIITTLDTFTSLLSGATIFGILGNLAHEMNVSPSEVVSSGGGTGLAFISYPDAIAKFKWHPWIFALAFFFMLFVLGIGSLASVHGSLNTAIKDAFPSIPDWKISAFTAICFFAVGLIYVTPGGQYTLDLVDHFGGTFIIFVFAILEVIAVTWLYGVDNLCMDLEFMTGKKVGIYWRVCWGLLMPGLLIIIFVYFLVKLEPMTYNGGRAYPIGLQVFGWSILGVGVAQMLFWVSYYLYANREYKATQMIEKTFSTKSWAPDSQKRREYWKQFKDEEISRKDYGASWLKRKLDILLGR